MIDGSDGDFVLAVSGGSIFLILLAIALYYVACQNSKECEARMCSKGRISKLLDHECVCVEAPK